MQPEVVATADFTNLRHRIDRIRRRRPDGCAHEEWLHAGGAVLLYSIRQRFRLHGEFLICSYQPKILAADACNLDRLLDGRMCLVRGVSAQLLSDPALV